MNKSFLRGWPVVYISGQWVYEDTKEPTLENWIDKGCGRCKKLSTKEGHDACLGTLQGVMNACCGHGQINGAYVQYPDGSSVHGKQAVVILNDMKINQSAGL